MIEEQLISVILPIYNVEKYLKDCIESVRMQTYRNLEIILVDDGSTDKCPTICDDYLKVDQRIKVIHKKNGGLSDARNVGIKASTGSYIALIDSDDFVAPEFIKNLYECCARTDSLMAVCAFCKFSDKNEIIALNTTENNASTITLTGEEIVRKIYQGRAGNYGFVAWNKLYHRRLFNNIEYPVGRIYEDTYTTYKLFLNSKKVALLDNELYFYRIRPNSIMTEEYNLKKIRDGVDADSSVVRYLYDNNYLSLLGYASSYFCKQTISTYYKKLKNVNVSEKKEAEQYVRHVYKRTWEYCKKSDMGYMKKLIYGIFRYII